MVLAILIGAGSVPAGFIGAIICHTPILTTVLSWTAEWAYVKGLDIIYRKGMVPMSALSTIAALIVLGAALGRGQLRIVKTWSDRGRQPMNTATTIVVAFSTSLAFWAPTY